MPEEERKMPEGMSRTSQTIWICGTLVGIAAATLFITTRSDDPCVGLFGAKDLECAASRASARIRGVPWSYDSWQSSRASAYESPYSEQDEAVPYPPEQGELPEEVIMGMIDEDPGLAAELAGDEVGKAAAEAANAY